MVYVNNSCVQGLRKVAQGIFRRAQGKACSRERARSRKVLLGARKEKPAQVSAQGRARSGARSRKVFVAARKDKPAQESAQGRTRWRKEPAQGVEGICFDNI